MFAHGRCHIHPYTHVYEMRSRWNRVEILWCFQCVYFPSILCTYIIYMCDWMCGSCIHIHCQRGEPWTERTSKICYQTPNRSRCERFYSVKLHISHELSCSQTLLKSGQNICGCGLSVCGAVRAVSYVLCIVRNYYSASRVKFVRLNKTT